MAQGVPPLLRKLLLDTLQRPMSDHARELTMAMGVLGILVGERFIDRFWRDSPPDPFMLNGSKEGTPERFLFMVRMSFLADAVFRLRDTVGFDVLVERLTTRAVRAPFYEAHLACFFATNGFTVEIRQERGVRGEDFDFIARRSDEEINVEVTEITNPIFSLRTIANKLNEKRSQVPNDRPAILCCILPTEWQRQTDLKFALMHQTFRFFIGSGRFNAVKYLWEQLETIYSGAIFEVLKCPLVRTPQRIPIQTDFLFSGNYPKLSPEQPSDPAMELREYAMSVLQSKGKYQNQWSFMRWAREQSGLDFP